MKKYRVWFRYPNGKRFYFVTKDKKEINKMIEEEEIDDVDFIYVEDITKKTIAASVFFCLIGLAGFIIDFNISLLIFSLVISWLNLTK